jgi:hypothetical protein
LNFDFFFLDGTCCDLASPVQNGILSGIARSFYFFPAIVS